MSSSRNIRGDEPNFPFNKDIMGVKLRYDYSVLEGAIVLIPARDSVVKQWCPVYPFNRPKDVNNRNCIYRIWKIIVLGPGNHGQSLSSSASMSC